MIFDFIQHGTVLPRTDRHRLAGTVYVDGSPARRLVVVIDRVTLILLAARFSNPDTGVWEIAGLFQSARWRC